MDSAELDIGSQKAEILPGGLWLCFLGVGGAPFGIKEGAGPAL